MQKNKNAIELFCILKFIISLLCLKKLFCCEFCKIICITFYTYLKDHIFCGEYA